MPTRNRRRFIGYLSWFFCFSCASLTPWKLDSIVTGDSSYNSARLTYRLPSSETPFGLEFLRLDSTVALFLNLKQRAISDDPASIAVRLQFGDEAPFEEIVPFMEGQMRLHFPEKLTGQITKALQDGKKVGILVDGFEEIISPDRFSRLYEKFTGSVVFFRNPLKGPIE